MSPAEVAFRVGRALRDIGDHIIQRLTGEFPGLDIPAPGRFQFMLAERPALRHPDLRLDPDAIRALLAGRIPVFGRWVQWQDSSIFWHRDPFTGAVWPNRPGDRPRHRPGNAIGDVRTVWEMNRLQHLVALASIAKTHPDAAPKAISALIGHLRSWLESNPFPSGVNHASALEEALRVIAVSHAFDLARQSFDEHSKQLVTTLLLTHAWHIERQLSLYSSTGNHTIGEATALLYVGVLLPEHSHAARWRHTGLNLLARESTRQIRDDGGSLEQATWYLMFVTELLQLATSLCRSTGLPSPPAIDAAIERAIRHLATLALGSDSCVALPCIGDADNGRALSPFQAPPWSGVSVERPAVTWFPNTGIRAASFGPGDQLLFLCKDLGMPPSFGHSHADLLSITLRWRGTPVLIDPGTYLYGCDPSLRAYFRSTAAHNTVTIDGRDQARQGGAFLWRDPAYSHYVTGSTGHNYVWDLAWHDGYRRLGLRHWRGILYLHPAVLAIWDFIEGPRQHHRVLASWHFPTSSPPLKMTDKVATLVLASGLRVHLKVDGGQFLLTEPATRSRYSTHYGQIADSLCLTAEYASDSAGLVTVIHLEDAELDSDQLQQWISRCQLAAGSAAADGTARQTA